VENERRRALIRAALYAVLAVALLIGGGVYVRVLIAQSFQTAGELATTRAAAYTALKLMLDEETGVRGYAATRDLLFLQPYNAALKPFPAAAAQLRADVADIFSIPAANAADDIIAINAGYLRTVAQPLIANPAANTDAVERHGKGLVDRFRADVASIDAIVTQREAVVDADAQQSIGRIGLLTAATVALVLLLWLIYSAQQSALAERVARERERYTAEKRIADTLQEAFVQPALPSHPTFRFSATYVPASEEAKVGGDWYDAVELPGNRVLFTIGDVTGHGIDAAVTMTRVRQAMIASALLDPMPAAVLTRVTKELYGSKSPLVTAVAGFADASTFEFVYASAGHPPPLLIEPGRAPRMLECGSLPLGAMLDTQYRTFRVQSVPGAMLVLYTDGAIEHSHDVIEGESILLAAAAEAARVAPSEPATFIHNTVFSGRHIGDDVAILTVGFAAEPRLKVA
jgi:serine phosphatase RsbU (regulator of sigma subunit)